MPRKAKVSKAERAQRALRLQTAGQQEIKRALAENIVAQQLLSHLRWLAQEEKANQPAGAVRGGGGNAPNTTPADQVTKLANIYWQTYVVLAYYIMGRYEEPELQGPWHEEPRTTGAWIRWFYGYGDHKSREGWFNAKDAKGLDNLFYEAKRAYRYIAMTKTLKQRTVIGALSQDQAEYLSRHLGDIGFHHLGCMPVLIEKAAAYVAEAVTGLRLVTQKPLKRRDPIAGETSPHG